MTAVLPLCGALDPRAAIRTEERSRGRGDSFGEVLAATSVAQNRNPARRDQSAAGCRVPQTGKRVSPENGRIGRSLTGSDAEAREGFGTVLAKYAEAAGTEKESQHAVSLLTAQGRDESQTIPNGKAAGMVEAAMSDCSLVSGDCRSHSMGNTTVTADPVRRSQEHLSLPLDINSSPHAGDSRTDSGSVAMGGGSADPLSAPEGSGDEHGRDAENSRLGLGTTSASSGTLEGAMVAAQAADRRSGGKEQGAVAQNMASSYAMSGISGQVGQATPIDIHGSPHLDAAADLAGAARGTRGGAESPRQAVSVNAQIALSKGPEVQSPSQAKTGQPAEISIERGELREIPESGRIRVIGRGASGDGPAASRVVSSRQHAEAGGSARQAEKAHLGAMLRSSEPNTSQIAETVPGAARRAQQETGFDSRSVSRTGFDAGAASAARGSHQQAPELLNVQAASARASSSAAAIGPESYTGRSNLQGGSQLNGDQSVEVDGPVSESEGRATRNSLRSVAESKAEQPQRSRGTSSQVGWRGSDSHAGVQVPSGSESSSATTVKTQPVVEVEGVRSARGQATNNGNQPGRTEWVTLRLDDVNGEAARVRVAVRGDSVRTTIMHPNESVVENLRAHLPDLQQALAREGLTSARLGVQSAAVAPNSGAQNSGGAPGGGTDGGNGSQGNPDRGERDGFNQHRERDDVSRDREESNNRQRSRQNHER